MRLSGTKANSTNQYRGLGDQLYDLGGARPTLDLNFANNGSLVDSVTGKNLVTHTRASSATYVDGDGVIQSATTNTPRFDHDPLTGESLGLLVEEARTNLLTQSKFDTGGTLAGLTRTLTTEINPAGEAETRRLQCTNVSNAHRISFSSSSANTVTVSTFVKKDTHRYVMIAYGGLSQSFSALFDIEPGLTTDRLLGQGVIGGSSTNISAGYQDYSNGWVRIWATGTTSGTNGLSLQLAEDATTFTLTNWLADGTEAIYVWGGQIEDDASFPTSLIHTDGSAVTRAADVTEITGNDFGTFNLFNYSEEWQERGLQSGAAVKINQIVSPVGTMTADLLYGATASIPYWTANVNITSGKQYTFSVYLKAATTSGAPCSTLFYGASFNSGGANLEVDWNLSTGLPENISSGLTASMTDVGNGWYRCQVTVTATTTAANAGSQWIRMASSSSDVYAWGAQFEESSTVTPYVKTDITFTSRASTATYYDYNGVIRTAAVDEARDVAFLPDGVTGNFVSAGELLLEDAKTNLARESEDFVTLWSPDTEFTFSKTASAPDGTNNATIFTPTTTSGLKRQKLTCTVSNLGPHTFSVYAKAAGYNNIELQLNAQTFNPGSSNIRARYELDTETVVLTVPGTNTTTSIENVGNGWYRCSFTADALAVTNAAVQVRVVNHSNNATFAGDGTSGMTFWGAQFEEGSYATSYIPTNGAEVTRAADVSSSSSNTFGNSFYNTTKGTIFASQKLSETNGLSGGIWFSANGQTARGIALELDTRDTVQRLKVFVRDDVSAGSVVVTPLVDTEQQRTAHAWSENTQSASLNGLINTGSYNAIYPNISKVNIGFIEISASSPTYLNGTVKRITYWPERLPNTTLQTITN